MQTTLLGLAIAFILALVAALVGPFFIDWSQFRSQFEAEATRIVGAPVRVAGALDARLLPIPSLQLHGVTIGGANDLGRFGAQKLDVEFSLGSLLRGEWRATELTVGGAAVDLGLNTRGRLDLPASTGPFNLGALAIDRLNVTGRIVLHDAASRSTLELDDIAFSGDVRSLAAGAMRGDGNFSRAGMRYPFRISSGQTGDGNGTRLRLVIEGNEKSPGIDLDGILSFEDRMPGFDGSVVIASATKGKPDDNPAKLPWRIAGKAKVNPSGAQFETVEANFGVDDVGLKLAGVADLRFGASPLLHAVLSAKQLDADRLLGKLGGGDAAPMAALRKLTAIIPPTVMPTRIEVSAEQIMLGGRPVQNIGADLHGDSTSWVVERLEFRAPGVTRVVASGAAQPGGRGFAGAINIDSAEPNLLSNWLKGRSDSGLRDQRPLRLRGNFTSDADRLSLDELKAEIDGGTLEGRIALAYPSSPDGSRIEAEVKADRLDLDAATALVRSLGGAQAEWPEAGQLSFDIGRAIVAGQEMRSFAAAVVYSPKDFTLQRLEVGQANGLMLSGSGAFDRSAATGKLTLNANVPSLGEVGRIIAPLSPGTARRIDALPTAPGAAKLKFALDVTKPQAKSDRADARMAIDIDAPQIKGTVTAIASPSLAAIGAIDFDTLSRSDIALDARLTAQGRTLLALLGLDHVLAAGDATVVLEASGTGAWRAPLRVKAKLSGNEIDADVQGSVEPWAETRKAMLTLAVRNANAAPLLGLKRGDTSAKASLSSSLSLAGDKLNIEDIDGTVAGSRIRGHVGLTLGPETTIDGQLGADTIELAPVFAWMIGARGHDESEPLSGGALQGWRGRLAFQALSAALPGGAELRPVNGTIRSDGSTLTIDAIKGKLGGGEFTADVDLRSSAATGHALGARIELSGAEGSALRYRGLSMPSGKASLKMSLTSQGRSASALTGAVSGSGLVTTDGLRVAGLDPGIFDVAILASDSSQATDDAKLKQILEPVLARGEFVATSAQFPFTIKDSRLRVGAVSLESESARATVSGGYDIVADQVDIRASLSGSASGGSKARPEIQLYLMGPPDRLDRSMDISSLSSWLAVRAIDRETQRLDLLERGRGQSPAPEPAAVPPASAKPSREAPAGGDMPTSSTPPSTSPDIPLPRRSPPRPAAAPPVASQQITPLPPPIDVRPAPGTSRVPAKPRPSQPLVITPPPAAVPSGRLPF
ncbi:MAG: AsmA family protein [Bradyrhizobiaceae bacterium]|nr:MAG: AsmA family protein [Bradyrhizobiaceae bacterium]